MILTKTFVALVIALTLPAQPISAQERTCENFAPPATFSGKKIFNTFSGNSLALKGINYYPRPNAGPLSFNNGIDFFTEEYRHIWERDIKEFQALRINTVRIYAVNPGKNHDAFMCALKAAGIYAIIGLAAECEGCAITWQTPPSCYPPHLKTRGEMIIKEFARYENVLAFSAGNEVSLATPYNTMVNAPCQKQFIRDMRAYIRNCSNNMRQIPVGLVLADVHRNLGSRYYNCQSTPEDDLEVADFIGINVYLHCDGRATDISELSGYLKLLSDFRSFNISVPVLLTEFGCVHSSFPTLQVRQDGTDRALPQRNFLQVDAMFSPEYRAEFQGGFVFEYSREKYFVDRGVQDWGIGYFEPENCDDIDIRCEYVRYPQFGVLAAKYAETEITDEPTLDEYISPVEDPPACPVQVYSPNRYTWPSDEVGSLDCPVQVPVFCLGVPGECVTVTLPPLPTSPVSPAPSVSPAVPSSSPTLAPSMASTTASTTEPTVQEVVPTENPTAPGEESTETINITAVPTSMNSPSPIMQQSPAPSVQIDSAPNTSAVEELTKVPTTAPLIVNSSASDTANPSSSPTILVTTELPRESNTTTPLNVTTIEPSEFVYPSLSPSQFPSNAPSDTTSDTPSDVPSVTASQILEGSQVPNSVPSFLPSTGNGFSSQPSLRPAALVNEATADNLAAETSSASAHFMGVTKLSWLALSAFSIAGMCLC